MGQGALGTCFHDQPEDYFEDRAEFRVRQVERAGGGGVIQPAVTAGEDTTSPEVTVPNPAWGMLHLLPSALQKLTKTMETRRFHTNIGFVVRKLSGVVGITITRTHYQKIVGKEHVKKKRKHTEILDPLSFSDGEPEEEPVWVVPGLDSMQSRAELAGTALEIQDVVPDEGRNMLTITFKNPLRAFAQTSETKDGEIVYTEVDPSQAEARSLPETGAEESSAASLGYELVGILPNTTKINLHFPGHWDDTGMLGRDSEGKMCFEELQSYLSAAEDSCGSGTEAPGCCRFAEETG